MQPKSDAVKEFLSKSILIGGGYEGIAAAVIQKAFRDCWHPKQEYIRREAAHWLMTDGYGLANFVGIGNSKFDEAIDLPVPRELIADVRRMWV